MARYLGLIPARGGSKGVARKNLAACGGKPLIVHSLDAAKGSKRLDEVIVSTDDPEIADVAVAAGVSVPFVRPSELSADDTPMLAVVRHAIDFMERAGRAVDAVVLLQPTSPLRTAAHIDTAVALFEKQDADTVVSVVRIPHQFLPAAAMRMDGEGQLAFLFPDMARPTRRQDKPALYARNGPAILVTRATVASSGTLFGRRLIGYEMEAIDSLDVDDAADLRLADLCLKGRG
jgi:CMP-N,N'-diacetyllegionaminic acid synthase